MNFSELINQTTREVDEGLTKEQVTKVILTMWRVMLEELMINPQDACIMINGFGKFFLKRKRFNCGINKDGKFVKKEQQIKWIFRFKSSEKFKKMLNGQTDLRDFKLSTHNLYYEKKQIKKPTYAQLAEGEARLAEMDKPKYKYDREEVRQEKAKSKMRDIASRLPED